VPTAPRLVGNRLALAGAVLYFLEWVAIAFIPEVGDGSLLGDDRDAVVEAYRGHAGAIAFAAGWFAAVLLGRILFAVALRKAFRDSGRESLLVDFAVGVMIVSVTLEIASFGPTAAAAWIADTRADASAIVALDAAGSLMFLLVFVPIGVSILAASAGMLGSDLFPRWLGGLGLIAGGIGIVGGIIQVAALGETGTLHDVGEPLTNVEALGFWIWLIATSVILWRHAPRRARTRAAH
jgi:Domain of unknown function (DUF4386)